MNAKYGFYQDCTKRLGKAFGAKCYDHIHKAFEQLPLACVVSDRILVCHGGLGDGRWTLRDIETVKRPLTGDQIYENNWIFNILWSDPLCKEKSGDTTAPSTFGVHMSPRRTDAVTFGWNVSKMFCARNGISLIVRSHECRAGDDGVNDMGFDVMHDRRVIRVFSARDYEGNGNSCAVLFITEGAPVGTDARGELTVRPQVMLALNASSQDSSAASPSASDRENSKNTNESKVRSSKKRSSTRV